MKLRNLIVSLLVVVGCGHPSKSKPATPTPAEEAKPAEVTPPEEVKPAPIDPAMAGCAPELLAPPAGPALVGFVDGAAVKTGAYWYCDLPDRVVLAPVAEMAKKGWKGELVGISRADGKVSRTKIASSSCHDACAGGGSAGCSLRSSCTIKSKAPGAALITTGMASSQVLGVMQSAGASAKTAQTCAPTYEQEARAVCSTATRTVFIRSATCGETPLVRASADLYEGAASRAPDDDAEEHPTRTVAGSAEAPDADTFRYQLADEAGPVTLTFHLGDAPSAELAVGDATEPCLAFVLDRHPAE